MPRYVLQSLERFSFSLEMGWRDVGGKFVTTAGHKAPQKVFRAYGQEKNNWGET